ncbi:hypothetical protein SLS64_008720 [Diaporthe eres]
MWRWPKTRELPNANPSISYWQLPPLEGVADHQSAQLPTEADVVIIGSSISGTSIAWHLLKEANRTTPLRTAILEARQACSGATGRNGGHIRPSSYSEYAGAKEAVTEDEAAKITRLRSAHVGALVSAANFLPEDGRLAAEACVVDSIDAIWDDAQWKTAVQQMQVLKKEVPDIGKEWAIFEKEEARNPYRFVHSLKSLLETYPGFSLDTNTAALNVSSVTDRSSSANYERPAGGSGLPKAGEWPSYTRNGSLPGGRAWSFFRNRLDYVVQMPRNGEYIFGGEGGDGGNSKTLSDRGPPSHVTASYLNGALSSYFGYDNWGAGRTDFPQDAAGPNVNPGRTKRVWVGIEGGSRDSQPFVGLLPQSATMRPVKNASAGGEWVSAAFDGECMCFACLCGRALSLMIASGNADGQEAAGVPECFPRSFLVTEQRLASRNVTRREAHHWMYPRMAKALSWDN